MSNATITSHGAYEPLGTLRGRGTVALAAVMAFLATVGVICRFASRSCNGSKIAWDEYMLVAGLFFYYTAVVQTCLQIGIYGQALHVWDVPPEDLIKIVEISFFNQLSYAFTMTSIKFSLLILFRRIFVFPLFRRIVTGVMVFNGLWFIFSTLAVILRCLPVAKTWDPSIAGHCAEQLPIVLTVSVWGLLLSVIIWSLPIPMVWRLHTTRKRKLGLTFLFALGVFDIAVGIVRVVTISTVNFNDPTYSEVPALQWLLVEPGVAILCASLPTCRPLMRALFPEGSFSRLRSLGRGLLSRSGRSGGSGDDSKNTPNSAKTNQAPQAPWATTFRQGSGDKTASLPGSESTRADSHDSKSAYLGQVRIKGNSRTTADDIELTTSGIQVTKYLSVVDNTSGR